MPDKKMVQAACACLAGVLAVIMMLVISAAAGCNHKTHTHSTPPPTKWEPSKRCKTITTVNTGEVAIIVNHHCLKEGVVTLAVAFLVPYKKEMLPRIAQTVRILMGEVKLSLFTMGRVKELPFFLFIVNQNY